MAVSKEQLPDNGSDNSYEELFCSKSKGTVLIEAEISDSLPRIFCQLWQSKKRCDLIVSCRREDFEVHSLIMYAYSPYFASSIDALDDSSVNGQLTVDCDAEILRYCIEFLYYGRIEVNSQQVTCVAELAKQFGILNLYRKCKEVQFKSLTIDNCLDALCFWEGVGDEEMVTYCLHAAADVFEEITETEGFKNLCSRCVQQLVTHEDLSVSLPGERLSAALAWIEYDSTKRAEQIVPFLQKLPLHEFSKTILSFASRSTVVQNNVQAAEIIQDALRKAREERVSTSEDAVTYAHDSTKTKCLVSMARLDKDRCSSDNQVLVTPLNFEGDWYTLADLPVNPPHFEASVGCVGFESMLYVSGLGDSNKEVWFFDIDQRRWVRVPDLLNSRVSHCMAHYDGGLYVLGGRAPGKGMVKAVLPVEVLHPTSTSWQHVGNLKGKECYNTCSLVTGDGILVHGIHDGGTGLLQLYKPKENVTHQFATYPGEEYVDVRGIVEAENHLIFCGADNVYVCSMSGVAKDRQITKQTVYTLPCFNTLVYLSGDRQYIYAVGGRNRFKDLKTWAKRVVKNNVYVHRARVKDVIGNTGAGWKPFRMNWPKEQLRFFPGAHSTADMKISDLEPV